LRISCRGTAALFALNRATPPRCAPLRFPLGRLAVRLLHRSTSTGAHLKSPPPPQLAPPPRAWRPR
jgi:hypothetical protein